MHLVWEDGLFRFRMENCLLVRSNIWVHLPRSAGKKSTHSEFWSIFVFISCCSWETGIQIRLHHPSRGMCLQGFRYFLENTHPFAAFGQTFCSLWALGNLSVTHLWQGNPRLVGVAWESSWWFMDSEDEFPPVFLSQILAPYLPSVQRNFWKPCI